MKYTVKKPEYQWSGSPSRPEYSARIGTFLFRVKPWADGKWQYHIHDGWHISWSAIVDGGKDEAVTESAKRFEKEMSVYLDSVAEGT